MKLYQKIQPLLLLLIMTASAWAQDITVHDPVMIKQKDTYYLYCTGKGISVFSSKDLKNWKPEPAISMRNQFGLMPLSLISTITFGRRTFLFTTTPITFIIRFLLSQKIRRR